MATPEISIVLPFHNAAATLPACLASIMRQRETGFELIAIDDGSSDGSAELVAALARADRRIRLLRPGRIGLVSALNLGLAEARGELVARMDADDLMHPDRLGLQRAAMEANPRLAVLGARVALFPRKEVRAGYSEYIRWQNSCLSPDEISENIYVESPFAHPSVMLRCPLVRKLGGYTEGLFPEDYELWLRMHQVGLAMAKLPRVLLAWRESATRSSRVDPRYRRPAFDELRARFLAADPRLDQGRDLVYWGTGRPTRQRARHLIERGFPPSAWIDIDPDRIGKQIWGAIVHPPDWLDRRPRPFVLVYVTNHGARDLIAGWLAGWGYRCGDDYLMVG